MFEEQAGGVSDQPDHNPPDSDVLLQMMDVVSARILGATREAIANDIVNHLSQTPPIHAAGVWLSEPSTGGLALSSWNSRLPDDHQARLLASVESVARESLGDPRRIQRDASQLTDNSEDRGLVIAACPIRRAELLGAIVVIARRHLRSGELVLLDLLARQAAAEIGNRPTQGEHSEVTGANTQFVALIAHELRTPLTALRGNVQLASMAVRKGDLSRVDSRLQAALKGVDGIATLVQNLQDISHVERGKFQLARIKGDLTSAVQNASRRAERLVDDDRSRVALDVPETTEGYFDPARVEQAIFNIILNALQYSPKGGAVNVRVECGDEHATVTISDSGIGIPDDEQDAIFTPYYRGSGAKSSNAKGMGLGLTISRETVQRHGGSIRVESAPGQGSTFSVQLPLGPS
jgi:signal transduction histidine kinase